MLGLSFSIEETEETFEEILKHASTIQLRLRFKKNNNTQSSDPTSNHVKENSQDIMDGSGGGGGGGGGGGDENSEDNQTINYSQFFAFLNGTDNALRKKKGGDLATPTNQSNLTLPSVNEENREESELIPFLCCVAVFCVYVCVCVLAIQTQMHGMITAENKKNTTYFWVAAYNDRNKKNKQTNNNNK